MQADDAANYYVNISYILLPGSDYVADPRPPPPPRRVPISLVMALPSPRSLLFNMHAGMLYKADGDACIPPQIISCGALHLPKGSGRVSVDCTPIHPLTCDATCPEGYVSRTK